MNPNGPVISQRHQPSLVITKPAELDPNIVIAQRHRNNIALVPTKVIQPPQPVAQPPPAQHQPVIAQRHFSQTKPVQRLPIVMRQLKDAHPQPVHPAVSLGHAVRKLSGTVQHQPEQPLIISKSAQTIENLRKSFGNQ